MSKIQFRLAARTDAAGKYNESAPLEGNEDNMYVDSDLSNDSQGEFTADQVVDLSEQGCLMVVADGMGGMNAGEVASDIAIKTVAEYFSPARMAGKSFRDSRARCKYMEEVVEAADAAIKADARANNEHEGMGSTIIMGWLCNGEICLTWCGDSRAYLFRPGKGFWQVSKDHSYVQGLVDDGKITMDEAFDHPYGNIITRSLGDPEKKAKADSKVFPVFEGDIFMLCSDGLSGVLRDHKTYDANGQRIETENLEDIIAANRSLMSECRDELFAAAERNDWYDNVTAILCEIVSGEALPADMQEPPVAYSTPVSAPKSSGEDLHSTSFRIRKKKLPLIIAAAVVLLGAVGFLVWLLTRDGKPSNDKDYFTYCKDNPTIENYRSYVKKYPQGEFVDLAQNWIKNWEADSTAKAKGLDREPTSREEPKPEVKPDEKGKDKDKGKEKEKDNGKDTSKDNRTSGVGETGEDTPKIGIEEVGKGKIEEAGKSLDDAKSKTGLAPAAGSSAALTPSQSVLPKDENEAYMACLRPNATIETCLYWMERYGDAKTRDVGHWNNVTQVFTKKYKAIAKSCDTKKKCEDFLNAHDDIMRRARMKGTLVDQECYKIVNDKLNELNKGEGKTTSSSLDRLQPGTDSPSAPTKKYREVPGKRK